MQEVREREESKLTPRLTRPNTHTGLWFHQGLWDCRENSRFGGQDGEFWVGHAELVVPEGFWGGGM